MHLAIIIDWRVEEIKYWQNCQFSNFLFNRSDAKFEINGQKFHFHKILSGTTKSNAEKICQERGTFLFEPRDATINNEVYQQMHKLTNYGYWLNIERNDTEHK